jgi:hypothetical protein
LVQVIADADDVTKITEANTNSPLSGIFFIKFLIITYIIITLLYTNFLFTTLKQKTIRSFYIQNLSDSDIVSLHSISKSYREMLGGFMTEPQ